MKTLILVLLGAWSVLPALAGDKDPTCVYTGDDKEKVLPGDPVSTQVPATDDSKTSETVDK